MSARRPTIYFDQFAYHHFGNALQDQQRFFEIFAEKGDLLFSSINMMELGMLRGRSTLGVRTFLEKVGTHWTPLEFDITQVVPREAEGFPDAAICQRLLELVIHEAKSATGDPDEPITLEWVMDLLSGQSLDEHRQHLEVAKGAMASHVAEWRALPPAELDGKFPVALKGGPTVYLLSRVIRAIIQEAKSHTWMLNDAFDFSHAVIPLAYADAVFLDKQWKQRIARLQLVEGPFARVFYRNDTDAFLRWFEDFPPRCGSLVDGK